MKIQFVIHADFEQPGIIRTWAQDHGFQINICRPFAGETFPKIEAFDWLILMGGPQSPSEANIYPYLHDEIELIKQALHADKMVLGFCLGAQLIGEAFGAKTEKSPHKEVGVFPIELTTEGKRDPLLASLPDVFPVVHWHNDMPGLTQSSILLAKSEGCPRQIVRYSNQAYGFQCHPEPTLQDIKNMILNCENDLKPGRYIQSKEQLLKNDYSAINLNMIKVLDNLLARKPLEKSASKT